MLGIVIEFLLWCGAITAFIKDACPWALPGSSRDTLLRVVDSGHAGCSLTWASGCLLELPGATGPCSHYIAGIKRKPVLTLEFFGDHMYGLLSSDFFGH